MYYQLEDISGHVWSGYFDKLVLEDRYVVLYDVDGYPIRSVPLSDIKAFCVE